jgi:hypothetical protein
MWVFSDAGTTATGENLYSFTHRTFLEFFAAAQLAYDRDTPERLARTLARHVARGEREIVAELAVQIKDSTSRDGARRVYTELLGERRRRSTEGRGNILQFMARTLRSVDPTPTLTRRLAREALDFMFSGDPDKLRQRYDEAAAFGIIHNRLRDWQDGNHPGYALLAARLQRAGLPVHRRLRRRLDEQCL